MSEESKNNLRFLLIITAIIVVFILPLIVYPLFQDYTTSLRIARYDDSINRHARRYALNPNLVREIIRAESAGYPDAVSPKGAVGLMQVTTRAQEDVMKRFEYPDGSLKDPDYNIKIGTGYLYILLDQFNSDLCLVLAAYNAGPARVKIWIKQMPNASSWEIIQASQYKKTINYVANIIKRYQKYK